jgi:hypothetical protein
MDLSRVHKNLTISQNKHHKHKTKLNPPRTFEAQGYNVIFEFNSQAYKNAHQVVAHRI